MEDIHPIKPPLQTPVLTPDLIQLLWVFLGLIIFLAAIILFFYFWKKRKAAKREQIKTREKIEAEKINYYKIAQTKLKQAKQYMEQGEYKIFYFKISEIIKEYLGYIYNENFIDMTTKEILNHKKLPATTRASLDNFFKISDLAKFAKDRQEHEAAKRVYELAVLLIK